MEERMGLLYFVPRHSFSCFDSLMGDYELDGSPVLFLFSTEMVWKPQLFRIVHLTFCPFLYCNFFPLRRPTFKRSLWIDS